MDFASGQGTWFVVRGAAAGAGARRAGAAGAGQGARPAAAAAAVADVSARRVRADISGDVVDSAGEEERLPVAAGADSHARHPRHGRLRWGDGDRGARRVSGRRGRRGLGRSRPLVAPAAAARGARRRRGGRGGADGDPAGRDGLHARARPAAAAPLERRAGHRGADRGADRLGDQRRLRPQPDPPGRAQGAAGELRCRRWSPRCSSAWSSGAISSLAGMAVYRAKNWQAPPAVRLALGGAATVVIGAAASRRSPPLPPPSARAAAPSCGPRTPTAAAADAAGGLPAARGGHHRRGRGRGLRRRVRPVPRHRRHRRTGVRPGAGRGQRPRRRGGRRGRHRRRLPAAAHRDRDGAGGRRPAGRRR